MVARVHASAIPKLTEDQKAVLGQTLREFGFKQEVKSFAQEYGVNFQFSVDKPIDKENSKMEFSERPFKRRAYFDNDRTSAFILQQEYLEFRTSAYTKYSDVTKLIQQVIDGICERIVPCRDIVVREISLIYVDIILPHVGRSLGDYFDSNDEVLPLSIFKVQNENDVLSLGSVQVTRVIEPEKKIVISLEQLPTSEQGLPTKVLPSRLVENDPKFAMEISLSCPQGNPKGHYALLTTESGTMLSSELQDLNFYEASRTIHQQTSTMFKGLINKDVCDLDWEFISE